MLFFRKVIPCVLLSAVFYNLSNADSFLSSLKSKFSNILFCNNLFLPDKFPSELILDLKNNVFGQPFVSQVLIPALQIHFYKKNRSNPLVLRFHGPIGVGKTLVADILLKSKFFKNNYLYSTKEALLKSPEEFENYKNYLKKAIEKAVRSCKRSVFVFDDLTEVTSVIFSELPPFKRNPEIDYSESLFIYISSAESEGIVSVTSTFLKNGIARMDFHLDKFLYGLQVSDKVKSRPGPSVWTTIVANINKYKNVEDVFIPFLPLDCWAVRKCIQNEITSLRTGLSQTIVEELLPAIGCPSASGTDLCLTGCKLIPAKLPIFLAKHDEF